MWMTRAFLVGASLAVVALPARAQGAATPLTLTEVLQLRRSGVPAAQLLQTAREYCLAFAVAGDAERALREAGADDALLGGLRAACSTVPSRGATSVVQAGSVSPAPLAIDDDFRSMRWLSDGTTSECTGVFDGRGFLISSPGASGCEFVYPAADLEGAVRVELTVSLAEVRTGSVLLGFARDAATGEQLTFAMHANGRFDLCRMRDAGCEKLQPTMSSMRAFDRSTNAVNRLAVELRAARVRLLVNDREVATATLRQAPTLGVVLGIGPSTTASFRRLRVLPLE